MPDRSIWTDVFLDARRMEGDRAADAALQAWLASESPEQARQFFDRLIRQIELPEVEFPAALLPFFRSLSALPADTDWQQVRLAQDLFLDHGPKFLVFLYYKSLPQLYCCAHGAEVLVRTGRLTRSDSETEIFTRRIAETGQFLLAVMARGGLQPEGEGIRAIRKVRLIHASIRQFVGTADWEPARLGVPVNQEDMAITLLTFSVSLIDALHQFGLEESRERLEAFYYTWRQIGRNLGVDERLIPETLADGRYLLERILQRQARRSEAGVKLTHALLAFANETLRGRFPRVPPLLIGHLIGYERAALLGLQPPAGCMGIVLPEFISALLRWGEKLEDRLEGPPELLLAELSRQTVQSMVAYFDRYKQRRFHIPEPLRTAWSLPDA